MPIYEYECTGCSSRFELRQSFNDNEPVSCPQCECKAVRIFSAVPIIFKGSGFYVTDSKSDHNHAAPESGAAVAKESSTD